MTSEQTRALRYAIIGCGLIGRKRANCLNSDQLLYACDLDPTRATTLARTSPVCRPIADIEEALSDPEVDIVVVATLNSVLSPIALKAATAGKHVLIEKPGAIASQQLEEVASAAALSGSKVRLGYNHRYHPALQKARELVDSGVVGELMFIRGRYGHGGRVGYESEWRADPTLSGGGELIDQGVHLIDIAGWFLGDFSRVDGHATTSFWKMPVDDNAFLSLRTTADQTAWLHVSCTEWKNLFSLELYGRDGKIAIDGLGGSYGLERCSYYKMLPQMGPPETTIWEFPTGDNSWALEMREFEQDIRTNRTPSPGLREGIRSLQIVEEIYRKSGYSGANASK